MIPPNTFFLSIPLIHIKIYNNNKRNQTICERKRQTAQKNTINQFLVNLLKKYNAHAVQYKNINNQTIYENKVNRQII